MANLRLEALAEASRVPVGEVLSQHAEEASILRAIRSVLVAAPHVRLHQLRRLDDRIAAHLDGLAIAGAFGARLCEMALENPGRGELFVATVLALQESAAQHLGTLLAVAEAAPATRTGLVSAFGWVSASYLEGIVKKLLASPSPFHREVGVGACAMHRVQLGSALAAAIAGADPAVRARALRMAGEGGRTDLGDACIAALADPDARCQFWAAYSAVLLGDQRKSIQVLSAAALSMGPCRILALQLLLQASIASQAKDVLSALSKDPANVRLLVCSAGVAGDPRSVPWLLDRMADEELSRAAGEAFTFITGADLAFLDLERKPPKDFAPGPNDDPLDENMSQDRDESLPWPDPKKIGAWWAANGSRFQAGSRYFMGAPVTREHCIDVLKNGYQRQRILAAHYLCLLDPGTPLFNTSAPAWRQQRLLAKMG
jgi:uncharacterized protein (TIGR02270 family)